MRTFRLVNIPHILLFFLLRSVSCQTDDSSYQERHKLIISPKTQSCFFLANMQEGYLLSISYQVVSSKNGKQQDISMRLKDPKSMHVTYQTRKTNGNYPDYTIQMAGDYELCFDNRHSMVDSKKVVWQYDIQGDEEVLQPGEEINLAVNQTLEEYLQEASQVRRSIIKVRHNVARSRHAQWWLGNKTPKDTERLESIISMIDTWSMLYSCLVCAVGLVQVFMLKRLFEVTPASSQLKMRI